jgi:integrase
MTSWQRLVLFLQKERRGELALSANSRRLIIKTAKQFMRFLRVPVNNEDFRDFVSLPRQEQQDRRPITKREIIELLNGAKDVRLKTFLMFAAVSGARPIEICAVRLRDLDLVNEAAAAAASASIVTSGMVCSSA